MPDHSGALHGRQASTVRGEGEDFAAVTGWRAAHEAFWHSDEVRAELGDPAFTVNDDTQVVAEQFRMITDERLDLPALLRPARPAPPATPKITARSGPLAR
jgi:hypothetical protein